jgi:phosphatidylserine/phosphatidylglycerophosphate/cardiolipin synthase-like enzyme
MSDGIPLRMRLKEAGFQASIGTTFSFYPPFYEEVVLRHLTAAGCNYNVLLADASQLSKVMHDPSTRPKYAGSEYVLLPLRAKGAFHPKVLLQLGRRRGRLFVGSHNMTYAGFMGNREMTAMIDVPNPESDPEGLRILVSAYHFIEQWLDFNAENLTANSTNFLSAALRVAPWLKEALASEADTDPQAFFLGSNAVGQSLFSMLEAHLSERTETVIMTAPFVDEQLTFAKALRDKGAKVTLALDDSSYLPEAALVDESFHFVSAESLGGTSKTLHAKVLYFGTLDASEDTLVVGSANPSAPAWMTGSAQRNAEAVFVLRGERARTEAKMLGIVALADVDALSSAEQEEIVRKSQLRRSQEQVNKQSQPIWLARALDNAVEMNGPGISDISITQANITDHSGNYLASTTNITQRDFGVYMPFEGRSLAEGAFVSATTKERPDEPYLAILLHEKRVTGRALSSDAQKMRDAFEGLDLDRADFDQVFSVVERVIVNGSSEAATAARSGGKGRAGSTAETGNKDRQLPPTLAQPTRTDRQDNHRRRKVAEGDFAELLNILIYALVVPGLSSGSSGMDAQGRNEEEQIGAEDDDPVGTDAAGELVVGEIHIEPEEMLRRANKCRARCRTLVQRMNKRLRRAVEGQDDPVETLLRLLATLALLRRLRGCDSPRTRRKNASIILELDGGLPDHVPPEILQDLWSAATGALFDSEKPIGLVALDDPGIRESEEFERLAGLLIWLGYEVGASVDIMKSHLADAERGDRHKRAALIAVLAYSGGTEIAVSEASESIDQVGRGGQQWLDRHISVARQLGHLLIDEVSPRFKDTPPDVGDFIYLEENLVRFWWISHKTPRDITCLPLANEKPEKKFRTSYVKALDIEALAQPNFFQESIE